MTAERINEMAKKAELLEQAKELGLNVTEKNTVAEIQALLDAANAPVVATTEEETEQMAEEVVKMDEAENKPAAKSGKRSDKAQKETAEKLEKEARKAAGDTSPKSDDVKSTAKKGEAPKFRTKLERRGKNYRKVADKIDRNKVYSLKEALELAVETNPVKFDASVEIHVRLGVDPRQADQNIRATVALPNGTGKTVRVAVFAPESEHAAATKAGADVVGDEDFLKQLDKEELNFDILVATPQYMPKLGKYARLLGPRGLMPNPKSGTVSADVAKAVNEAKAGRVEYRVDKQAVVHLAIGKVSFGADKLASNATAFFESLRAQKPSSIKGTYVKSTFVTTTMGPSVKMDAGVN